MDVPESPLADAVAQVGDRWTLRIVAALLDGGRRFGELQEAIEGIAPNVLSQRLKHLERAGVVTATRYSTRPPRFSYDLTAAGAELAGALRLLAQWGAAHAPGASGAAAADPLRHEHCGTPLEARWYCPTCAAAVDPADDGLDYL